MGMLHEISAEKKCDGGAFNFELLKPKLRRHWHSAASYVSLTHDISTKCNTELVHDCWHWGETRTDMLHMLRESYGLELQAKWNHAQSVQQSNIAVFWIYAVNETSNRHALILYICA